MKLIQVLAWKRFIPRKTIVTKDVEGSVVEISDADYKMIKRKWDNARRIELYWDKKERIQRKAISR